MISAVYIRASKINKMYKQDLKKNPSSSHPNPSNMTCMLSKIYVVLRILNFLQNIQFLEITFISCFSQNALHKEFMWATTFKWAANLCGKLLIAYTIFKYHQPICVLA